MRFRSVQNASDHNEATGSWSGVIPHTAVSEMFTACASVGDTHEPAVLITALRRTHRRSSLKKRALSFDPQSEAKVFPRFVGSSTPAPLAADQTKAAINFSITATRGAIYRTRQRDCATGTSRRVRDMPADLALNPLIGRESELHLDPRRASSHLADGIHKMRRKSAIVL